MGVVYVRCGENLPHLKNYSFSNLYGKEKKHFLLPYQPVFVPTIQTQNYKKYFIKF